MKDQIKDDVYNKLLDYMSVRKIANTNKGRLQIIDFLKQNINFSQPEPTIDVNLDKGTGKLMIEVRVDSYL